MTYIVIAATILLALDAYIISQLRKHEVAIVELLTRHPDMLINEDGDDI